MGKASYRTSSASGGRRCPPDPGPHGGKGHGGSLGPASHRAARLPPRGADQVEGRGLRVECQRGGPLVEPGVRLGRLRAGAAAGSAQEVNDQAAIVPSPLTRERCRTSQLRPCKHEHSAGGVWLEPTSRIEPLESAFAPNRIVADALPPTPRGGRHRRSAPGNKRPQETTSRL
jgi:hypothetical protein